MSDPWIGRWSWGHPDFAVADWQMPYLHEIYGRAFLTDADGRCWEKPQLDLHANDVVTLVWGDPPMLVRRRPLPRRWWQLRARWDIQIMPLRPWTDR